MGVLMAMAMAYPAMCWDMNRRFKRLTGKTWKDLK